MEQITALLTKFRYIFKILVMLNIDKRKVSDLLNKLDEILRNKNTFNIRGSIDSLNNGSFRAN